MKGSRNLFKAMFQRVTLVTLSILAQLAVLALGLLRAGEAYRIVSIALSVISWGLLLYIISASRARQAYKLAWAIPLLVLPVLGILLYAFFGGKSQTRRTIRQVEEERTLRGTELKQDPEVTAALEREVPEAARCAGYLLQTSIAPVYRDCPTEFYSPAEEAEEALLEALEQAEHYLFLEYFILSPGQIWDRVLSVLERKAAQGVDVRLLYDDFGCIQHLPMHYARQLREKGIRAYAVNPYIPILSSRLNNRDHRKMLISDGVVAFTGGVNLSDEYFNKVPRFGDCWKDSLIRVEGEAVWSMTVAFLCTWHRISGEDISFRDFRPERLPEALPGAGFVQPYFDSPRDDEQIGENAYLSVIHAARKTLDIQTPYLVIDEALMLALCATARSGVRVRIFLPGVPDKWYVHMLSRACYGELIEAGVEIYEFKPGFLHSKIFLADEQIAVVGTINLDFRSLYLHYEDAVLLVNTPSIPRIRRDFEELEPQCERISASSVRSKNAAHRLLLTVLRVFAPLF